MLTLELRASLLTLAAIAGLLAVTAPAGAATGDLVQKPGAAGCLSRVGFCTPAFGLDGALSITVSPDGRSAYAATGSSSAVVVFDRAGDGTLIQKRGGSGCISDTGAGRCRDGRGLGVATSVAVSPDGDNAYVVSETGDAVAVFDRRRNGGLVQKPGRLGCISDTGEGPCVDGTALDRPGSVTISPDGENAYVASRSSDAVAVFDRAEDGRLTQKPGATGCISDTGDAPCAQGEALDVLESVTVSPDGENAYVASVSGVAVFNRAADGTLTQKRGAAGCISDSGAGSCEDGRALLGPSEVAVSPDGRNAYVASETSDAVAVFERRRNGGLVQKAATAGCISGVGAPLCVDGKAVNDAESVTVSPDGQSVYVAADLGDAVAVFDRAPNGTLAQKPGTAGCLKEATDRCANGTALNGANEVTVSPDGENVYVASRFSDAVVLFDRQTSPPLRGP